MIEEQFGDEDPCECCGHDTTDCICPECPVCGEQGNPACYALGLNPKDHGLKFNKEQLIGQAKMRIASLQEEIQYEENIIEYLQKGGEIK
jgi:hypothetical protein